MEDDAVYPRPPGRPGDMTGTTVLVTGSTDGIGRETAVQLAALGAAVLVHGRDLGRGAATLAAVRDAATAAGGVPGACELYVADVSCAAGARALAAQVRADRVRLDVLVNNAGVYAPERVVTRDGFELTFAVNVLAPFILTEALVPLLRASAPARVVNLSSTSQWQGVMHWDDLQLTRGYTPLIAYAQSKLAMTLLTLATARRFAGSGVAVTCLDPGNVETAMLRAGWPSLRGVDHVTGAATSVYLASSPDLADISGVYYEHGHEAPPPAASRDRAAQDRLWSVLERMADESLR